MPLSCGRTATPPGTMFLHFPTAGGAVDAPMPSLAATSPNCHACPGLAQMIASPRSLRPTAVGIPSTGVSASSRISSTRWHAGCRFPQRKGFSVRG